MQIIIATPYKIANFGAVLQAWALRHVLLDLGHSVAFLNCRYMWPGMFGWTRLLCSRSLSALRSKIRINRLMRNIMRELGGFAETEPYDNIASLISNPPAADCYIAGSDQIFGANYFSDRKRYLPIMLGFGQAGVRRIAYGASFGTDDHTMLPINAEIRAFLRHMDFIGIREVSGVKILREWSGETGSWTPDPTLLLKASDYIAAFRLSRLNLTEKYVCTYMLGWEGREKVCEQACKEAFSEFGVDRKVVRLNDCESLSDWLQTILNSSCIVTNSYHGFCFSRIFNIPCKVLEFDGRDSWRNERTRDLQRVLSTQNLESLSAIGLSALKKALSI